MREIPFFVHQKGRACILGILRLGSGLFSLHPASVIQDSAPGRKMQAKIIRHLPPGIPLELHRLPYPLVPLTPIPDDSPGE